MWNQRNLPDWRCVLCHWQEESKWIVAAHFLESMSSNLNPFEVFSICTNSYIQSFNQINLQLCFPSVAYWQFTVVNTEELSNHSVIHSWVAYPHPHIRNSLKCWTRQHAGCQNMTEWWMRDKMEAQERKQKVVIEI